MGSAVQDSQCVSHIVNTETLEERRSAAGKRPSLHAIEHACGAGAVDGAGVHTNTEDTDCCMCKGDLFLSAAVSPAAPGRAACPEHAAALGAPPGSLVLLYRCAAVIP